MEKLEIKNLHVSINNNPILKGVDLSINQGEIHALMGPNGTGKSTLSYALMGHPKYTITQGDILLDGKSIIDLDPNERSHLGLFLAFQYPVAIPGVSTANFLRTAVNAKRKATDPDHKGMPIAAFRKHLKEKMDHLEMDASFAKRYLNDGFSGGEKKKAEILQMAVLEPKFAILDETDSGLDIDALKIVSSGVNTLKGPNLGVLIITHYQRILNYIKPDFVHVLLDGRIVESGSAKLAEELEKTGYEFVKDRHSPERMNKELG